jgi:formamidopyrimidine-DNA glycosylase
MPELPDILVYIESLEARIAGQRLNSIHLMSPFLLRTFDPPIEASFGKSILGLRRLGKRIVFCLEDSLFLVLHLMIAGRLHWRAAGAKSGRKTGLAVFDFPHGSLILTEAGTKRRASLHLVSGEDDLALLDPGGLEVLDSELATFSAALTREVHTLKRAMTDPHILSGIGNAYSDEILHRARLSPLKRTDQLDAEEMERLFNATRETLTLWISRLRGEAQALFPEKVTAFRPDMAVHGRYRLPCPDCGAPVQRVVYAENEMNYCPRCQTGGKLLADRALSRLLHSDWPRNLDELEDLQRRRKKPV